MNLKNRCYNVAICKKESPIVDFEKLNFFILKNGWNYWVADPFPIEENDELFIFGEMFEYSSLKGSICYSKLTDKGFTKWKKIIEEPYHLSFPNIFKIKNNYYMCPESQDGNILQIYKCIRFPDLWQKEKIIHNNIKLVDTIFYNKDDEVYGLSCKWRSLKEHDLVFFKLLDDKLIFSEEKLDTMKYYYTRPAGKILYDQLRKRDIMISQNCKNKYGSGLVFKEVKLDFPFYSEKEIKRLYPCDIKCNINKTWDGVHTFNVSKNYIAIDMIQSRLNIVEKFYRLKNRITRYKKLI